MPESERARQALSEQLPDSKPSHEKSEGLARVFMSTGKVWVWVWAQQPFLHLHTLQLSLQQAQICQGQILLRGHTMSPLSGARTELLKASVHQ